MLAIILIVLIILSFLTMVSLILVEERRLTNSIAVSRSASQILEPAISATAHSLTRSMRQLVKYLSIHFLLGLHALVSFGHAILTRIERRFALLIDAVRGRGERPNDRRRGSVSFFLEQIKDYKEEMTHRENTR